MNTPIKHGGNLTAADDRLVLDGVPRVHFYDGGARCPEDIPFPSVMRALMEYLDERDFGCQTCRALQSGCKINCSYAYFVGVTGTAAFLSWKPGWHEDNLEIAFMSNDPRAPFARALQSTGYEYIFFDSTDAPGQEQSFREQIVKSIQAGKPVIAFGPIGPPEASLITGYDEAGEVLIGWSFFQNFEPFNEGVAFEPSGQFRKRDWFNYPPGFRFITLGQKKDRPPLGEIYRQALAWLLDVTNQPITSGCRHNGLVAYTAWAEHLLQDEDFPNNESVLRQRHDVHNSVVGMLAEARWYGSQFLIQASNPDIVHYKHAENLLCAAACYAAEHNLMWELWDLVGGNGNPEAFQLFADPAIRRKMIPIIAQGREKNAQAADYIQQVLMNHTNA